MSAGTASIDKNTLIVAATPWHAGMVRSVRCAGEKCSGQRCPHNDADNEFPSFRGIMSEHFKARLFHSHLLGALRRITDATNACTVVLPVVHHAAVAEDDEPRVATAVRHRRRRPVPGAIALHLIRPVAAVCRTVVDGAILAQVSINAR